MTGTLAGRVAVVTGVSRRAGIGFAIARELLANGARVLIHGWTPHDADQPWGADPAGIGGILEELGGGGLAHISANFADSDAPAAVIERAVEVFGAIDVMVANHARSSKQNLTEVTARNLICAGRSTRERASCSRRRSPPHTTTAGPEGGSSCLPRVSTWLR